MHIEIYISASNITIHKIDNLQTIELRVSKQLFPLPCRTLQNDYLDIGHIFYLVMVMASMYICVLIKEHIALSLAV